MSADGVPCPTCKATASRVLDSRPINGTIRRRRKCDGCGSRFTSYETAAIRPRTLRATKTAIDKAIERLTVARNEIDKPEYQS